jgi:hypothetical protein
MAETTPSASDVLSNLDNYDFSGVDLSFLDNIDPFDPAVRPNCYNKYPHPTSNARELFLGLAEVTCNYSINWGWICSVPGLTRPDSWSRITKKVKSFGPRAWWLETSQRRLYPNLSKMALDLLSIPAMSAEVERLFSHCKITITERRASIGIDSVQATECLKSWLRKGNISYTDINLDSVLSDLFEDLVKDKGKEVDKDVIY